MSGGHYNYACYIYDVQDLVDKQCDVKYMVADLETLGYADDLVSFLVQQLDILKTVTSNLETENIAGILRVFEYWKSCDYDEDDFKESLSKWRLDRNFDD